MTTTSVAEKPALATQSVAILPWLVCFSAALFFFYEFIQLNMFNAISGDLMRDFHINASNLSRLSATYLAGDVVFLFPAGMILDRFSVRTIIISAMVLCIFGTLIFANSNAFAIAAFAHFLAGIGNAFSLLSCIKLASRWFPPKRMALVIGLVVTFAMIGGMVAQTPLTLLAADIGWRHALMLNAGLGIAILSLIALVVRDFPAGAEAIINQQQQELNELGLIKSIVMVIRSAQNWLCGIYTSLMNLPIMILGALWGSLHLIQVNHLQPEQAGNVVSMIFLGTIIGSPIIGWISDKLSLRRMPMIIASIIAIVIITGTFYLANLNYYQLLILYFLLGLVTSSQILSYPTIAESNPRMLTGTGMGLASVLIMGGAGLAQLLSGWLLDFGWNHVMVHGSPLYSTSDFNRALSIIPIGFIIALIASFLIRETHCQPYRETNEQNERHISD